MGRKIKKISLAVFSLSAIIAIVLNGATVSATVPYVTERVNLAHTGGQMTSGNIQAPPVVSQDGRYVAFSTTSSEMVAGDTNGVPDVFVRDRNLGTTTRASVSSTGSQLTVSSGDFRMSSNGRFILFSNGSASVVSGDTNGKTDLFLRDLKNNTTEMVSLSSSGGLINNSSSAALADISADGRYITFSTGATNVVSGDTNGFTDVFVRDRKLGTTVMISKSSGGALGDAASLRPSISCDGAYIAFVSLATNLVTGDTNGEQDIFLVDRVAGDLVTNITAGGNGNSAVSGTADISCNGERVVFTSEASNLVSGDSNSARDIFAYSIIDGTFERVNLDPSGSETVYTPNPNSGVQVQTTNSIDYSGRYVVFSGSTQDLVSGDTNGQRDVFIRDLEEGVTQIISKRDSSTQTNAYSGYPSISLDGRYVAFTSSDTGLVMGDTNAQDDFFLSETGI